MTPKKYPLTNLLNLFKEINIIPVFVFPTDIIGTQDTPLEKKLDKSDAALVPDISGSDIGSDSLPLDGAIGHLAGSTLGEQIDDSDEDDNYPEAWTPFPAGETKRPPGQDPVIGEGNLLCPENWVCSTKGKSDILPRLTIQS